MNPFARMEAGYGFKLTRPSEKSRIQVTRTRITRHKPIIGRSPLPGPGHAQWKAFA